MELECEKLTVDLIQKKNDLLRNSLSLRHGKVMLTNSIATHPFKSHILKSVSDFNNFCISNDPYGEHDCALVKVSVNNEVLEVMFKIDYYDENFEFGEVPTSPNCKRVLTIMLAHER